MPHKKPKPLSEQPVSTNYNPYRGGPMTEQQYNEFTFRNRDVDRVYNQENIKVGPTGRAYNKSFLKKMKKAQKNIKA